MEMEVWIMPLRVAPVISYDSLRKGKIERPKSGLDRFNLTDVGEFLLVPYIASGGTIRLHDVKLPYPWKIETAGGSRIEAVRAGNSTFRSIIRITFRAGNGLQDRVRTMLEGLGRHPLETPYWDNLCWEAFHRESGRTRDDLVRLDERAYEALGIG